MAAHANVAEAVVAVVVAKISLRCYCCIVAVVSLLRCCVWLLEQLLCVYVCCVCCCFWLLEQLLCVYFLCSRCIDV